MAFRDACGKWLLVVATGCTGTAPTAPAATTPMVASAAKPPVLLLDLFDEARKRPVPVAIYLPDSSLPGRPNVALLSHGYGGHHTDYSFIANTLTARGYLVASVQQELPTDEPLPTTGNPRVVRRPNWERGVQNLVFVRQTLRRRYPRANFTQLLLLGHSNGGDVAMLFAEKHPGLVARIVSLDNRRMPLPRARHPRVLTIRSSDQVADPGVLPTPAEQGKFGTRVVKLPNTLHNDMWDGATEAQKQEIRTLIQQFLES